MSLTTSCKTIGSFDPFATFIPSSSDDAGSRSDYVYFSVQPNDTSTTLTATPRPTILGDTTTLTAAISAAFGMPTGTVTFYEGQTLLATQPLSAGKAVAIVGPLARDPHALTATYASDRWAFGGSRSPAVALTVDVATTLTSIALTATPQTSTRGQAVTLTASVAAAGGIPLGHVVFADGPSTAAPVIVTVTDPSPATRHRAAGH